MTQQWFYADSHNQQQGPVEGSWLATAHRERRVGADTLVWREGLAGWVPLATVASQLGLAVAAGPPALPARRGVAKPPSSASTWVIVLVVCLFGGVAFIGILAAIALPAYQDYTMRARVAQALVAADAVKPEVLEFRAAEKRCPVNGEGGVEAANARADAVIASIEVGPADDDACAITLTFAGPAQLAGRHLTWSMDAAQQWHASSDVPARYLPASMRTR
ncbi:pilin [Dokdonella sp.]|uniref:pilin n=1 Tax=Dokdonella sp. TaxID=2291710 RepID=UPI003782F892